MLHAAQGHVRKRWPSRRSPRLAGCILLALAVIAYGTWTSWGQNAPGKPATLDELESQISEFLDQLSRARDREEAETAFRGLLARSRFSVADPQVQTLIDQAETLTQKYGRYRGSEKIRAQTVGGSLVLMRYLYRCDTYPIVWYFTFYKPTPEDNWTLVTVRFDTQLELQAQ